MLPHKFEAGTPNVADAVGLAAACEYLDAHRDGRRAARTSDALMRLATERLARDSTDVRVYGPPPAQRSGVVSFTVGDIHPHDLATILDEEGVCIRAGHHCAQPLMRRLDVPATARASFYVYNDETRRRCARARARAREDPLRGAARRLTDGRVARERALLTESRPTSRART